MPYIQRWWSILGDILPFPEWRTAWNSVLQEKGSVPLQLGRRKVTSWLYAMEIGVCRRLKENVPHDSFTGLCSELSAFSSGCGKSKRSKTCRATKHTARRRLKERRTFKYKASGGFL
jgi:hypothetical protein